mmetsp:Transcript_21960/g.47873  ORF Transcript_21960/g.47873 Transcript_21960/m.47873 type:complete len:343 (-) Transcript_21960:151-1179(-)
MRQQGTLFAIALVAAVGPQTQTAHAFAPPSAAAHHVTTGTNYAERPVRRTLAAPSTWENTNFNPSGSIRLNLIGGRPTEEEVDRLESEIRDLESRITATQAIDRVLLGALAIGAFLAIDGATCAFAESDMPCVTVTSSVLTAASNGPDYVREVGGVFEAIGSATKHVFELFFQLLAAVLPIFGKAAVAAGKAAVPAIQKGAVAFGQYLGVAAKDSSEAAKPYIAEASKAAQPLLDQAGSKAQEAASVAGSVVTTKAAVVSEQIQSVAGDAASAITGKAVSVGTGAASPPPPVEEAVTQAAEKVVEKVAEQTTNQASTVLGEMGSVGGAITNASERTASPLSL